MRCKQASDLMEARLDGRLDRAAIRELNEHLGACTLCRAEWQKMHALDRLLRSAPTRSAPVDLHAQVLARIKRREEARRGVVGGLALVLGAAAVALLTLLPIGVGLMGNLGVAPALLVGGVETIVQLLTLVEAVSRMLFVLLDRFAVPLAVLVLGSLMVATTLNGLWIVAMRRLRVAS